MGKPGDRDEALTIGGETTLQKARPQAAGGDAETTLEGGRRAPTPPAGGPEGRPAPPPAAGSKIVLPGLLEQFIKQEINAFELFEAPPEQATLEWMRERVGRLADQLAKWEKSTQEERSIPASRFVNLGHLKRLQDSVATPAAFADYQRTVAREAQDKARDYILGRIWAGGDSPDETGRRVLDYTEIQSIRPEARMRGIDDDEFEAMVWEVQKSGYRGRLGGFEVETVVDYQISLISEDLDRLRGGTLQEQMRQVYVQRLADTKRLGEKQAAGQVDALIAERKIRVVTGGAIGLTLVGKDPETGKKVERTVYSLAEYVDCSDGPAFHANVLEEFYDGQHNSWLRMQKRELVDEQKRIAKAFGTTNREIGFEEFVQRLDVGAAKPQMSVSNRAFELGGLPNDETRHLRFDVLSAGRGYLSGKVALAKDGKAAGLSLKTAAFEGERTTVELQLETAAAQPGERYQKTVVLTSNGTPEEIRIPISYHIVPPEVEITADGLDLGTIPNDARIERGVRVENVGVGGLRGEIKFSKKLDGVDLSQKSLDSNSNYVKLVVDAARFVEGKAYETSVQISTNGNPSFQALFVKFAIAQPKPVIEPAAFAGEQTVRVRNDEKVTRQFFVRNDGVGRLRGNLRVSNERILELSAKEVDGGLYCTITIGGPELKGCEGKELQEKVTLMCNGEPGVVDVPVVVKVGVPKMEVTPADLDLGRIEWGDQRAVELQIKSVGDGLSYGTLSLDPQTKGIKLSAGTFEGNSSVKVRCHSALLEPGGQPKLVITHAGEPAKKEMPIKYRVARPIKSLLLGTLCYGALGAAVMALPRLLLGALGFPNWGLSYLGENANYSFLAANAGQYWPFALAMVMTVLAAGGLVAGIVVSAKLKREKLQMEQWLFLKEDEPKA